MLISPNPACTLHLAQYCNVAHRPLAEEDPQPAKRARTDGLQDEDDFIAANELEFSLSVQLPSIAAKYGGKLVGQVIQVAVSLTEKVADIKAKIQEQVGIPPGKQTLKVGATTLSNFNSLAFYNIGAGKSAVLTEKTRGGRK
jgi:splicing factor 3A subunit 1